jgi:hypothetical protein
MKDILEDKLNGYDVKKLTNKEWYYRLRYWSVRFIFKKTTRGNVLMKVNNRGDSYKGF